MQSQWNPYPYYQNRNTDPAPSETQQLLQIMISIENQMHKLNQLMEQNNLLLRQIEQQQSRVYSTGGGGSVIVRM
jgi:hypothetical protein